MFITTLRTVAIATACVAGLTACSSSGGEPAAPAPSSTVNAGTVAAITPVSDDIIAAAEKEGSVVLYTNADEQLMKPIADAFRKKYPSIELRTLDMSDPQIYQRYATERATGASSADVVMTSDQVGMIDFVDKGNVLNYEDPNVANLPDYAKLAPGVVAMSEDPLIALFNTTLLPKGDQPTTMVELADLAPSLKGKIGTTDIGNAVQLAATSKYIDNNGESGWENLEKIGPGTGVESGVGNLTQKLLQGQYEASFFVSGSVRALIAGDAAKVLNYSYLQDGTPLIPRAMAITAEAQHPNAAKVFMNFVLSVEGQEAACKGGFTPYRSGVECAFGLSAIEEVVGRDNLQISGYDVALPGKKSDIVTRWNDAFNR